MVYKRFGWRLTARVLLLTATLLATVLLFLDERFVAATAVTILLAATQVVAIIRLVQRTNRDLERFLTAVEYSDFSQTFIDQGLGDSHRDLKAAFNRVITRFQETRSEKEQHFRFLNTVVQHVGVGVLSFDSEGTVNLVNNAARRLLNRTHLRSLDALETEYPGLVSALRDLRPGQTELVRITHEEGELQLVVSATELKLRDRQFTLVSLQNIGTELEEREMEAWQKLIRVLTHEIMNSITPITSLAGTAGALLKDVVREQGLPDEATADIRDALRTIESRSRGLQGFVDAYRNLTRIPKPRFRLVAIDALFENTRVLMRAQAGERNVRLQTRVHPEGLQVSADPELVEQILINLVLNAVEAGAGTVRLEGSLNPVGRVLIQVIDDGPGLQPDQLETIFIPFFTTKKKGSGIGLSLARQIMRLHRGTITVQSRPGEETVFTLLF